MNKLNLPINQTERPANHLSPIITASQTPGLYTVLCPPVAVSVCATQ